MGIETAKDILGIVLAGGRSRRFGSDKACATLGGRSLLAHALRRAAPQVGALAIAGGDAAHAEAGVAVIADMQAGTGPLAGVLAGLEHAERGGFAYAATFPCDTPFFPRDVVAQLRDALPDFDAPCAMVSAGGRLQGVFSLWRVARRHDLRAAYDNGARSFHDIVRALAVVTVPVADENGPLGDPFFNINTEADLRIAERWLRNASGQASLSGQAPGVGRCPPHSCRGNWTGPARLTGRALPRFASISAQFSARHRARDSGSPMPSGARRWFPRR
jgi:molybdenum cofactor guanylyltransferase